MYMPRGVKKGLDTKKFERCVSKVKGRSGKSATPYAVCNATIISPTNAYETVLNHVFYM
jgi:hypothetical protein